MIYFILLYFQIPELPSTVIDNIDALQFDEELTYSTVDRVRFKFKTISLKRFIPGPSVVAPPNDSCKRATVLST